MLETIVGRPGPNVIRDAKLFEMSEALEMFPVSAEDSVDMRSPENWAGKAHTCPLRSRREDPLSLHYFRMWSVRQQECAAHRDREYCQLLTSYSLLLFSDEELW